jgi:hypothetical protein
VLGTAVAELITLTVNVDQWHHPDDEVSSRGAMPECHRQCTHAFVPGTLVTLTAGSPTGARLLGWTGGGCSAAGTCTPKLQSDTEVTAVFASSARSDLAAVGAPGRDTLRGLLAGATLRHADLPLPGTLAVVWTDAANRRVLATARVIASAPGRPALRMRITREGRALLGDAPQMLIDWRAVFATPAGRSVTLTGRGHLH